jgi:Tol biopolymer transport system component
MKRTIAITLALSALAAAPAAAASSGSIAYHQTDSDGAFQIWSVPAAGGSAAPLTSGDQIPNPEFCFEGCFSEHPDWAFDGSRIFFDSDRAGTVHVFSMAADGSDVRQVTYSDGGFEGLPGISPDGNYVAYDGQPEDPAVKGGIFMTRVDGSGTAQRLTTGPRGGYDTAPQFSPDGSTVAFVRFRPISCPSTPRGCGGRHETGFKSAIYLVGTDGQGLRPITDPGRVWGNPQWSPDGTRLLINSYYDPRGLSRGTSSDLWTVERDGSDLTPITRTAGGEFSFGADWSPDGSQIAFVHYQSPDDHSEIQLMNADGSDPATLTACEQFRFCDAANWGVSAPALGRLSAARRAPRATAAPFAGRRQARRLRRQVHSALRARAVPRQRSR